MGRKLPIGKRNKKPSILPKAPPLHEEPLRGIEPGKLICEIWKKPSYLKANSTGMY